MGEFVPNILKILLRNKLVKYIIFDKLKLMN